MSLWHFGRVRIGFGKLLAQLRIRGFGRAEDAELAHPAAPGGSVHSLAKEPFGKLAEGLAVLFFYASATFAITYPLFLNPATTVLDAIHAYGPLGALVVPDIYFTAWVMAWGWHALTSAPSSLFDANIFAPAPRTLAGSEHMLGHLPIFGPFFALSGNPVLAYQANLFLSFTLCGCAMYALLRHWGTSRFAALLGGFIYAFAPVRLHMIGHAHLLATQYLPVAVIFLDRTLRHGRVLSAVAFAAILLLQMLCSYYTAYATVIALAGYVAGVAWATRLRLSWRNLGLASAAALAAVVPFVAISIPYVQLKTSGIIPQYQEGFWSLTGTSAGLWRNYLYPPGLIRQGWRLPHGAPIYVGILPLLTALALAVRSCPRATRYSWPVTACLGSALACYVISLGPKISVAGVTVPLPYALALRLVPGFDSMRVVSRIGLLFMFGFAGLVGLGAERVMRKLGPKMERPQYRVAAAAVFLALVAVEYDFPWRRYLAQTVPTAQGVPEVYQVLRRLPPAPLLEIPGGTPRIIGSRQESEYVFLSIFHWRPLLNGYSGYRPPSYLVTMALARALPEHRALELLQRTTGLGYLVVHLDRLPPGKRAQWNNPPGMRVLYRSNNALLLTPEHESPTDLLPALLDFHPRETTILGTPIQPVSADQQQVDLRLNGSPPTSVFTGLPLDLEVVLTNRSTTTWPALASVGEPLVYLGYRFVGPGGRVIQEVQNAARLPDDPRPGVPVRATLTAFAPQTPGDFHLVVGLSQGGKWFPTLIELPISVKPWPK